MSGTKFIVQTLLFPTTNGMIDLEVGETVSDSLTFFPRILHRILVD
jgi:hypothetical protein